MNINKFRAILTILAAVTIVFSLSSRLIASDKIMMGATPTASIHYAYSVSAGKAINKISGDHVSITVVSTGGSVDNLERINRGQINLGLGTWAAVYQAYKGIGKYKERPMPNVQALWVYTVCSQSYIVRADSGVKKLEDLNGKKFGPGNRGSATEQMVQQILGTVGVKPNYFRGGLADAVAAVKDGRIAGYAKSGSGLNLDSTTKEVKSLTKIRILNFPPDKVAKIKKAMPFIQFATIPDGSIPGIPGYTTPVQIVGFMCYPDSLTEKQAYYIVKAINEGQNYQEAAYPALKGCNIPNMTMKYTQFPLHKGAVRYYKEIGVSIPKRLIPPETD